MMIMDFTIHLMEVKIIITIGFWDADGFYFNKDGFDKHGGYYDDEFNYIHGEGWDEKRKCYNDEDEVDYYEDDGDGKLY